MRTLSNLLDELVDIALAAEEQQACKDEADAAYEAAKSAADLPGPT